MKIMQRGFSLVEMAIALAALALVIGGLLVPLKERQERQQLAAAHKFLAAAQDAVRAYMLAHYTARRELRYHGGMVYTIPAGRPFLPCPDVTGDGVEDRVAINAGTLDIAVLAGQGACQEQKGLLPWSTLGLRDFDPWGSRLTYRVDAKFSNAVFGFDETFSADMFDLTAAPNSATFGGVTFDTEDAYVTRDEMGAVVCSELISAQRCPNSDASNVLAGVITRVAVTLGWRVVNGATTYSRVVSPLDHDIATPTGLIDGPAFVIVSHGKDGLGAVTRNNICRNAPADTTDQGERVNAYYAAGHPMRAAPFNCADLAATGLYENLFVARGYTNVNAGDTDEFDDVVVWSSPKELFGFLARGGQNMPLEKLEFLNR